MTLLPPALRRFVHEHDRLPAFHAGYLLLTLIAAAMLGVGFFAMLVLAHILMDVIKYRAGGHGILAAIEESLPDLALLGVSLTAGVYLDESFAFVAGLSGMLRAEVLILDAFAMIIPKFLVGLDLERVIVHPIYGHRTVSAFTQSLSLAALLFAAFFLFAAPVVLGLDWRIVQGLILEQLAFWMF